MSLKHIHGGNIREAAIKYGVTKENIKDFSANINPLGASPLALKAIQDSFDQVIHYPDPQCQELRQALGRFIHVGAEHLIMGNGAAELIYLLVKFLAPRKVLIPAPSFSEYELAVITNGGEVKDLYLSREDNFRLPVAKVIEELAGVDLAIICNPNNPTGQLVLKEDMEAILDAAEEKGTFVLVDEAFIDFVPQREKYSILTQGTTRPNLMVLYSLTKFFGIPGLRLGSAIANPQLIRDLAAVKDPWNVNCFAQAAGIASLLDNNYIEQTRELVWVEQEFLYRSLREIPGINPLVPSANYIFADIREMGLTAQQLQDLLGRQGILVRNCTSYKNLDSFYIRVAVKNRADNLELIAALKGIAEGS